MPSFADSIFLFVLALLLFGPKKLPVLARELGKWMGEFRRASNEFKMQMDEELRASEQAERQQQITAMEAAAPIPPALSDSAEPEHPHLRRNAADPVPDTLVVTEPSLAVLSENSILPPRSSAEPTPAAPTPAAPGGAPSSTSGKVGSPEAAMTADGARPLPIATSGSLHMMPPATGLPTPRSSRPNGNPLGGLVDSIPAAPANHVNASETGSLAHGD